MEMRTSMHTGSARLPANAFDFLRFVLASLVVLSHSYPLSTGTEAHEPLAIATHGQITFGALAVDSFFVISGFLILHSWRSDPRALPFLRKRILRIYPAFLVAAAIDAFIVTPAFSKGGLSVLDGEFVGRFAWNAVRLLAITPGPAFPDNPAPDTVNGSLWSISYEFWCYLGILALGIAGWAVARRGLAVALLLTTAIGFVFEWRHLTPAGNVLGQIFGYPPFWARLLPFFVAGMTFYAYRERIVLDARGAAAAIAALVVACFVPHGLAIVLPIASAYLIFWFAFLGAPRFAGFGRRGDFSYGIYLFSFPILQIIVAWWGRPITPVVLFILGWTASLGAALLSWHLLEKHCIRAAHGRRSLRAKAA